MSTGKLALWQGYQLAMEGKFAEAIEPLTQATEQLSTATKSTQFTLRDWLFETEQPQVLALLGLAECELRNGNLDSAREHYHQVRQMVSSTRSSVLSTRVWPSPASPSHRLAGQ